MTRFNEFELKSPLIQAVEKLGFETPTEVQAGVIPLMLSHSGDIVALAPTGTGKTAAFGLPVLQELNPEESAIQALIITPTRELCAQIASDMSQYAAFMPGTDILPVYGGAGMRTQIQGLKRNPHIVTATPGRLLDHMKRGTIDLSGIKTVILDEADEMLSMGFREDIEQILKVVPEQRRVCLFSATMPKDIQRIINSYLRDIKEFKVDRKAGEGTSGIEHSFVLVRHSNRERALEGLVAIETDIYGIVFCKTKTQTKEVANTMAAHGFAADALHGDLSQVQREYVMNRFRNRYIKVLVATDVAARGIDVEDLSHVIHYELPDEKERYIHRSGRTGRAGKKGVSIAIVTPREMGRLRRLEKMVGTTFTAKKVPGSQEILVSRLAKFVDEIEKGATLPAQYDSYTNALIERLSAMPRTDLIKSFLAVYVKTLAGSGGIDENINLDPSKENTFDDGGFRRGRGHRRDSFKRGRNRGKWRENRGGGSGRRRKP